MATITFKNKGKNSLYLTRNYTTNGAWNLNVDNIGFNTSVNEFKDK